MKKRIFISLNLPTDIKNRLVVEQQEIDRQFAYFCGNSPIKWTKKDNLHITLFFVGYMEINDLPEIFKIVENAANKFKVFEIKLKDIIYAPLNKMPPKMVWVRGESSEELLRLQKILETSLLSNTNVVLENEEGINKNFTPHITLGRIAQWQWSRLDPEEIPALNKDFLYSFNADSIKVMESQLKRGGAEYSILKSFSLNQS